MDWNAFMRRGRCGGVFGDGGGKEASTSYETDQERRVKDTKKYGDEPAVRSGTLNPDFVMSGTLSASLSSGCIARFGN